MNLVDRVNRQRSLTAMSRTLRSGCIAANTSVSTTTYTYDANGNVAQTGGWTYVWDYLNRMLASGYNNSTTTYGYDTTGARVLQTSTTSTTYYPSKYFSLASTTSGGTSYSTSTNYIWLGDTLLSTIDQKLYNGAATGTAITRYIHPDHLGSTNAVTDQSGALVQLLDYYPYGATRVASTTYPTNEKRQYIGQYTDTSGLSYLQARYYDSSRGQFVNEDPVFWGNPKNQTLANPQGLNSYSYANDNPIVNEDPTGLLSSQSPVNISRNLISDLISFANNLAAYVYGLTSNPSQAAQSARQTASSFAANPSGFASKAASSVASGAAQSAVQTWNNINSGDDAAQERGITDWIEFSGGVISAVGGGEAASLGKVNNGTKVTDIIKGFNHDGTYHGLDQITSRGVTPQMLRDTVINPVAKVVQPDGRIRYVSTQAVVVVDQSGQVVTAYTSATFNQKTINLIQSASK
jgi:RHS repeat-associated protein